jgi:hypothetical protein
MQRRNPHLAAPQCADHAGPPVYGTAATPPDPESGRGSFVVGRAERAARVVAASSVRSGAPKPSVPSGFRSTTHLNLAASPSPFSACGLRLRPGFVSRDLIPLLHRVTASSFPAPVPPRPRAHSVASPARCRPCRGRRLRGRQRLPPVHPRTYTVQRRGSRSLAASLCLCGRTRPDRRTLTRKCDTASGARATASRGATHTGMRFAGRRRGFPF